MICGKCGADAAGAPYTFYYGSRTGGGWVDRRTFVNQYRIAGPETVFLCNPCVGRAIEWRARLIGGGVFLGTLLLAILRLLMGPAPQGSELETVIGFPTAFVFGLVIYLGIRSWKKGKNRQYVGDALAIKIRKAALRQSGYDAFFTRDDYLRLS